MSINNNRFSLLVLLAAFTVCGLMSEAIPAIQTEITTQKLVPPPYLPEYEQIADGPPKTVKIRMVIEEKLIEIDNDGTKVWAMTFNGSVPGPMIVVHQDDYIELTLVNSASNTLQHNIDFHAATGALGGGGLTNVNPGQEVILKFKLIKPGVFVYHCAPGGLMVPWHVVSGMNGAIMVLPRDGLKDRNGNPIKYDKAYYVGEQDFYIPKDKEGNYKTYSSPIAGMQDMLATMRTLIPTHIVFNGRVDALTGDNSLTAKVGETVLIIHSQANRDTRPHLIGGHGDFVWAKGSFDDPPETGLETWFIPGGAAGAMIYTFKQPGLYAYLNHNLIEAFMLGAVAHFKVEGEWDDDLMKQIKPPQSIYID